MSGFINLSRLHSIFLLFFLELLVWGIGNRPVLWAVSILYFACLLDSFSLTHFFILWVLLICTNLLKGQIFYYFFIYMSTISGITFFIKNYIRMTPFIQILIILLFLTGQIILFEKHLFVDTQWIFLRIFANMLYTYVIVYWKVSKTIA